VYGQNLFPQKSGQKLHLRPRPLAADIYSMPKVSKKIIPARMGNQGIRYRIGIALLTSLILAYCLFIYFQDRSGQPGQLEFKLDTLTLNIDSHYIKRNTSTKFSKRYGYNYEANSKSLSINSTRKNPVNWVKSNAEAKPNHTPMLVISLDNADSVVLEKLPGIGPVLSARIIKYRDKLGGFYEVDQLREVYGLSDSVFSKIAPLLRLEGNRIKKIAINSASEEELRKHPYLQWKLAKQLIKFREAHGSFEEVKDLEEIWGLDRDKLKKLIPYLVFNIDSSRKK
jgi:DNA uptake protein ComE-like DNA-binding protein